MKHWRVYLAQPRIEFGIDYPTLEDARAERDRYQQSFPSARYYIRCIHSAPLALFLPHRKDGKWHEQDAIK